MTVLILFVDGLPYGQIGKTSYLQTLKGTSVRPGFGYSVNQQAELFADSSPDDLGYFGEWTHILGTERSFPLSLLGSMRRVSPIVDRGVHYVLDRKLGIECANIPFGSLPLFERVGQYPLTDEFDEETVLDRYGVERIVPDFEPIPYDEKDKVATQRAVEVIRSGVGNLLVSLPGLDGTGHNHGVGSAEYDNRLREVDEHCRRIVSEFERVNQNPSVVIVSDHGMANANRTVDLGMEERFGPPTPESVVYFYDSLYLRCWVDDEADRREVESYLESKNVGEVLEHSVREANGVSNRAHGDVLFILDEGYSFAPNYFGLQSMSAYHGYHPDNESQQATFLHHGFTPRTEPNRLSDVYGILEAELD